ncbi:unnamed protein product [Closterium sp. NIES-54]
MHPLPHLPRVSRSPCAASLPPAPSPNGLLSLSAASSRNVTPPRYLCNLASAPRFARALWLGTRGGAMQGGGERGESGGSDGRSAKARERSAGSRRPWWRGAAVAAGRVGQRGVPTAAGVHGAAVLRLRPHRALRQGRHIRRAQLPGAPGAPLPPRPCSASPRSCHSSAPQLCVHRSFTNHHISSHHHPQSNHFPFLGLVLSPPPLPPLTARTGHCQVAANRAKGSVVSDSWRQDAQPMRTRQPSGEDMDVLELAAYGDMWHGTTRHPRTARSCKQPAARAIRRRAWPAAAHAARSHAQPAASCSKPPHAALRPLLPAACCLPPACCLLPPACCLPAACCLQPACLPACRLPAACLQPAFCLPATACLPTACSLPACLLAAYCRLPAACLPAAACLLNAYSLPACLLTACSLPACQPTRPPLPSSFLTGPRAGRQCTGFHTEQRCFARLSDAWRAKFPDATEFPNWVDLLRRDVPIFDLDYEAILAAMYALSVSAKGDCYLCVPPDPGITPGIAPAALGACESAPLGTAPAHALHTFTLDSGASHCFFRDSTTVTPLPAPVLVSLADPSGGPVLARSSTVLPCPAVPSGELSSLHLPSFSTNLVSNAVLQDAGVDTFTPGRQRVAICTCSQTGRHLATFARAPGSSLYTLTTTSRSIPYMHSRLLVSGLPMSLPPLPPSPAPPCIPCVEGRQRAAPHSSSFSPTEAPLQTLHLDRKGDVPDVLIPWIRATRLLLCEWFQSDFPVLRLHSDRGGEFSSDLLAAFCAEHGIRQTFTLPASPQQNGVAERRIGLVMEVARTSMIHAAAPHFLWPFAVRYAAHQLNLWPRVSLPETSPTLLWTGKVGDASRFWVWGARAFVRDTTADKLSPRAIPCIFLGFVPDTPGWQFYDPASRRRNAPRPPPPLFLAPGPPQVDPLPAPGPAPSGVSQVDPPAPAPVEVTGDSGPAASGAVPGGAELGGAESGGAEREEPGCAASGGAASGGAEPVCAEPGGAEFGGESPEGSANAFPRSPWSSPLRPRVPLTSQQLHDWYGRRQRRASAPQGSTAGGSSAGVAGPGGARTEGTGAAGAGGVVIEGTGAAEGAGAAGGTGAAGGAGGAGAAEGTGATSGAGAAEGTGTAGGAGVAEEPGATGGAGAAGAAGGARAAGGASATGAGGTAQQRLFFAPPSPSSQPPPDSALRRVLSLPSSTGLPLQPGSPLPAPSPYTEQTRGLAEHREPASRPVSPVRSGHSGHHVPRQWQPAVSGSHLVVRRPSSPPLRVPLLSPPVSSLPVVADPASDQFRAEHSTVTRLLAIVVSDPSFESAAASALVAELVEFAAACRLDYAASLVAESKSVCPPSVRGECALGTDVLEDRQEDLECLAAAAPHLVSMLLAPEGDPDAPDIPTPRSYAEAIAGEYSSQWQTAMDAEMAS